MKVWMQRLLMVALVVCLPTVAPASSGNIVGPLLYNPGAFAQPQGLTFGNEGRNFLRNPGRWNFDMGLVKTFKITERQDVQFRAEGFNIFNRTQFSGVNRGGWLLRCQ